VTRFLDLSTIGTGAIVAPAGHGKTYTIGRTVVEHPELSILILTHTHAGISALRKQIGSRPIRQLRMETIASFALRIARAFPARAGWTEPDEIDLELAHLGALKALESPTVLRVIAESYDLLVVDEYQDCSVVQAGIIDALAALLTTVVVGDPLQGIFDFGSQPIAEWNGSSAVLPLITTLTTPHRWAYTNPGLGEWLSAGRSSIEHGEYPTIDHSIVDVVQLQRNAMEGGLNQFLDPLKATAIITPNSAAVSPMLRIARSYQGRVHLAEAADFTDLRNAARIFDDTDHAGGLVALIELAASAKTAILSGPIRTLKDNLRARGLPSRSNHAAVIAAKDHLEMGTAESAAGFLRTVLGYGKFSYRPELPVLMLRALATKSLHPEQTLYDCVESVLEQRTHSKTVTVPKTVVGSTLRLKGLEFDTVIILDPKDITSFKHLYVALTRATRRLVLALS
jgi:hypothetical protein